MPAMGAIHRIITRHSTASVIHGCSWWRHPVGQRKRAGRALARRGPWGEAEVVLQGMAILPGRRPAEFSIVRTAAPSGCRCRDHQGAGTRDESTGIIEESEFSTPLATTTRLYCTPSPHWSAGNLKLGQLEEARPPRRREERVLVIVVRIVEFELVADQLHPNLRTLQLYTLQLYVAEYDTDASRL